MTRGTDRTVDVKKLLVFVALAFVIFYVLSSPVESAEMLRNAGGVLSDGADSMSTFVTELF